MKLHLTPEMLEAAYELLKTTPPFRGWRLPDADDVEFRVINHKTIGGCCRLENGKAVIEISRNRVSRIDTLIEMMAHEMIHTHEELRYGGRNDVTHSWRFLQLAKRVCHFHKFDENMFCT